ncbi:hypothetical protein ES702_00046 [subsurface metagenome]
MAIHNLRVLQNRVNDKRWLRHTLFSKNALLLGIFFLILSPGLYVNKFKAYISLFIALGILLIYMMGLIIVRKKAKYLPVYVMLVSAFIPSLMIGFIGAAIGLILFAVNWPPKNLDTFTKLVFLFTGFLFLTWLVHLGYTTDFWCLPLYLLTFCAYILVAVFAQWRTWTPRELDRLAKLWILCIALQVLPMVIKPLAVGQPSLIFRFSDLNHGTLTRAHYAGVLLSLLIVFLILLSIEKHKRSYILLAGAYVFLFYVTDTKHAILAMLPAVGIAIIPWLHCRKRQGIVRVLFLISILLLIFPFLGSLFAEFDRTVWNKFVINPANPKSIFFRRTINTLSHGGLNVLMGLGPGGYASRVAVSRAIDVLYKESYKLPSFISPFSSPIYRKVMRGLYTGPSLPSVVLGAPFSSLMGVFGELGLFGTVILTLIYIVIAKAAYQVQRNDKSPVWRAFGGTAFFAVPYLWGLSFLDSYMEQPNVIIPFWILFLMILLRRRLLNNN